MPKTLISIPHFGEDLDEEETYRQCDFCSKIIKIQPKYIDLWEQQSAGGFYCSFCLRHGFNHQPARMLTFSSIFGYYYLELYRKRQLTFSEILDYIDTHVANGLSDPQWVYDHETFQWFIKSDKIRSETLWDVVAVFEIAEWIPGFNTDALVQRYLAGENRPSLIGCGDVDLDVADRKFFPCDLVLRG